MIRKVNHSASLTIEKIIQQAKNNDEVDVLWLYGSQARHTANENSDYDLAIALKAILKTRLSVG